jgi:CRP/FNR family cyclic AMP-dependent transcriptional regulator
MSSSSTVSEFKKRTEDVLAHLPVSAITRYKKRQLIYSRESNSIHIHMVVSGSVEISQITEDSREVLLEIIRPDELFGETAFVSPRRSEQAIALEDTALMTWPVSEIETLVMQNPRLAVALLQVLVQRNEQFGRRIESFAVDSIEQRLARSLIHFSERLGSPGPDGSVEMMPITHLQLSNYVGTSREIVTHYMNQFRRRGYVSYSRRSISLHGDSLRSVIDRSARVSAGAP